jgi:osmoprotectant transport system substrate-binding protein
VTKETADKLGLSKISDLSDKAGDLVLYGSPECRRRLDCLLGLEQVYGLKFKKFVPVAIDQRHEVLSSGRADVSIVFTTDPQIKRNNEVLLDDDKGMFPPYNSTLVVRKDVYDKAGPDLSKTVELINKQLTDENMQELNARVDLDKKEPGQVAKEYLSETGLVQ